jgi:hypothetical protein
MLHFDPTSVLRKKLAADRRPPDGKLHPSGDLIGSLRHAQLRAAGAPTIESQIVSDIRLMSGTMWHKYFEDLLAESGHTVRTETKLDKFLPTGWSGTADWIIHNPEIDAYVLGDLKTIKGEGLKWVLKDGMKDEHMWQLSAYWYALEKAALAYGEKLVKGFVVLYLPQNVPVDNPDIEPVLMEGEPLDRDLVLGVMNDRWAITESYLNEISVEGASRGHSSPAECEQDVFLNEFLAEPMEREQRVLWNKGQSVFDVKLVPHWSCSYCPYPNELCDCSEQGVTKIGAYDLDGVYTPRKAFEDIEVAVAPTYKDIAKKKEELAA